MVTSRTTAQDRPAGESDRLLATKLTLPRPRSERLPRPRLIARLDEAMARDVILVCAPAGFGKTTLLAGWAQSAKWPVAWLSLDRDDNDPVRFWRYATASLDRVSAGVGGRALSLLSPPNVASGHEVVIALLNELEALSDELVLVFDDYHVIESAPIHESLTFFVGHLPPQLRLVIATRSDPPLQLARLRARDRLAELRAGDLRFTHEESSSLLREVWGLDLAPASAATLEARTEGWAVGLQLAALSLQGRANPDAFLEGFTGAHHYVLDYLSEEVLERQPERVRTFLLRSSVLERLSGPLCDAVIGASDGQDRLEELERANLFLVPLDDERRWYRFHPLFGDLLRARLQRTDPHLVPELHQRAATWCEQHRLIDDGIRHALASGDPHRAARLVERHLPETLRRGEGALLERWLSQLPDDALLSHPVLCLAQALMLLHVGSPDTVERLVDHAERAFERWGEPRQLEVPTAGGMVVEVPAAIALLRAELAGWRGDADRLIRFAESAASQMTEEEVGPRLWARLLVADADWMRGALDKAECELAAVLAEGRSAPTPDPVLSSCFELGRVQQARGKLSQALRTYRQGLHFATTSGRFLPFNAGEAHLGIAQVLYARNEIDDALEHAIKAVDLTRQIVEFRMPSFALATLARIRQAMGEPEAALEAINEASRMFPWEDVDSMWYPSPTERARLLLAQARIDDAVRWVEERGLSEDDEVSYPRESDYLVLARVLLGQSESGRALALLERLGDLAEAQDRMESAIEIRALRAMALQAAGDRPGALAALGDALSMARPEGYIRVFADEGPPMAGLVRSFIGARKRGRVGAIPGREREHLTRVIRAFAPMVGNAERIEGDAPALIEPLTTRELEVLLFIAAGRRNQEIADELVVTLETVKKHVSHIFDKLGVTNRTEAVTQARELGLIS